MVVKDIAKLAPTDEKLAEAGYPTGAPIPEGFDEHDDPYLSLPAYVDRIDDANEALKPIREDMNVIENHAYHRLLRLFKGELTPQDVLEGVEADSIANPTSAYGIAIWHRSLGEDERADAALEQIMASGNWAAFGFIAAEADLARPRSPAR